jgi:alanine racemase
VIGAFGRSRPDLGDFQPPTLETLPLAVARNVAIARAWTRARIMAVVKADGYGHGACTVAQAAVAAGAEWLGTTDIAEASEPRATGLNVQIPHSTMRDGLESGRPSFSWPSSALGAREGAEKPTHGWPIR